MTSFNALMFPLFSITVPRAGTCACLFNYYGPEKSQIHKCYL